MTTAQKQKEVADGVIGRLNEIVEKHNIHFLSVPNKFALQNENGAWDYIQAEALYRQFLIQTPDEKRTLDVILATGNRMKKRAVNTFRTHQDDALNVLSRQSWLQPVPGTVDPIFDIILNSLSGGRQNVRDHIEKVFVYKYLHPETYTLPCITISGEGGAGKNEFIEKVLRTVFGVNQVEVMATDEAFGQFNGRMLGKTVVYIDEAVTDKTDANALKRKVGNQTIDINVKYGIQDSFDNTPWYWIGGNGTNGAVMLSGDTVDRRYSVLTVKHNVMHWVAQHLGVDVTWAPTTVLPDTHKCVQWYGKHAHKLEDARCVAAWLDSVLSKWSNQEGPPSALHDEDYRTIRKAQKSVFEELMESVFHDPEFTHIKSSTLYEMFKLKTAEDAPAVRAVKKKNDFEQDVAKWLLSHEVPIEKVARNFSIGSLAVGQTSKRTSAMFYVNTTKPGKTFVRDNSEDYISVNDYGKQSLVARAAPIADVVSTDIIEY